MFKHIIFIIFLFVCPVCHSYASMPANTKSGMTKIIADGLYKDGNYPLALTYYIKGMEIAEKEDDKRTYMACIGNIANIYEAFGDYEANLFYLLKGYKMSKKLNDEELIGKYLTNIVPAYCHLGNIKKAKEYYDIAKKMQVSKNATQWEYFLIYNSARIKQAERKYDEAVKDHLRAAAYAEKNELDDIYVLYQESETGNILVKKHDYGNAIKYGAKCRDMSVEMDNAEMEINAYKILYEAYAGNGDSDSARKYRVLYLETYDSVFSAKGMNKARGKLQEYESRKSTEEISSLTSIINIYTLAVILISILLIITIVLAVVVIRKNRNLRNAQRLLINKNNDLIKSDRSKVAIVPSYNEGDEVGDDEFDGNAGGVDMTQEQADALLAKINEIINTPEIISDPDLSLKIIADMAKSNTKYVSFVINKTYNKNFRTYINEKRIMEACRMLSDNEHYGNMTIQAIYEEVGYTNATSFNRTFKKINGMTPAMYKKLAAKEK